MAKLFRIAAAAALIAGVQGCTDDARENPPGTCSPTPQTEPDPASVRQFCVDLNSALCDRSFGDCPAIGLGELFASGEECRSAAALFCASEDFSREWLDAACGATCVAFYRGADCATILVADPQACAVASGSFPPDPIGTISAGSFVDEISTTDPTYEGGHARAWSLSLAAGQSVAIETAAAGTAPIGDTVVHLFGPAGALLAENDDSFSFYSRVAVTIPATGDHLVVVRGYSSAHVGTYQLTVAIE
jgi:hypothetical protein